MTNGYPANINPMAAFPGLQQIAQPGPAMQSMQLPVAPGLYYSPVRTKPSYDDFVLFLESRGLRREQLILNQTNTTLSQTFNVPAGATLQVAIRITAIAGQLITIKGTEQVPAGADRNSAHGLRVRLADSTDTEIGLNAQIQIIKRKSSGATTELIRASYSDIAYIKQAGVNPLYKAVNEYFKYTQGVFLVGQETLDINVTPPAGQSIDQAHIIFAQDLDLWSGGVLSGLFM